MKIQRLNLRMPLLMAGVFGVFWSGLYAFMGMLHGMPAMFDREFPFLLSGFLGVHNGRMSAASGFMWAFADGAFVAFALSGLMVVLAARSSEKGGGES